MSRRARSLIGVMFVIAAMLITVVLFRSLEIMRGAPPLSAPKAEDGFLFFIGLIAVVVIPSLVGTRVARLLWRSGTRFTGRTSINSRLHCVGPDSTTQQQHRVRAL